MKKFFTLVVAVMATMAVSAANVFVSLTQMTAGTNSYAYDGNEVKARSNNVYIALPSDGIKGDITFFGSSDKPDRYLYIKGQHGTVTDDSRPIQMKNSGITIAYTTEDILSTDTCAYLVFTTADDFKFKKFNYTYETDKAVISTVETLINAKVNGVALDPNFLSELIDTKTVEVLNAYATAPTVTFTKHVVITYDDSSTKESDVDVEVVAEALGSDQWRAGITLGDDTYSITMPRAAAYTVTYKLADESVLGTEVVAAGGHPAEYAQYEVRPLCTFDGWFDADYIEEVDMTQVVVNSDMSFYADFTKAYAQSIDFEGMVINNGKSYDVKSALTANFYDYKNIDALDSLNDAKGAGRNEAYLGLKIKKQGGYLACNLLPGTTIRIKFGYVAETVLAIAGGDTLRLNPTDNQIAALQFPIMVDTSVKLQTTSDKTVVIKQIMIDQPIATWMYPITYEAAENGKVEGWNIAFPNETVTLTATPDDGYKLADIKVNGTPLNPVEGVYTFTMTADTATVSATFEPEGEPVPQNYTISIAEGIANGTVGADYATAEAGETITLTIEPAEGYKVEAVKYNDGEVDHVVEAVEGVYSFTMPAANVTVSATFVEDGEPIVPQPEIYTITVTAGEHGTASAPVSESRADERIELTIEPDEGYQVKEVLVNGEGLMPENGVYSFTMPAKAVTVVVTFEQAQGIDEINAAQKAVKRLENGMLLIEKNGVLYNVQGIRVK